MESLRHGGDGIRMSKNVFNPAIHHVVAVVAQEGHPERGTHVHVTLEELVRDARAIEAPVVDLGPVLETIADLANRVTLCEGRMQIPSTPPLPMASGNVPEMELQADTAWGAPPIAVADVAPLAAVAPPPSPELQTVTKPGDWRAAAARVDEEEPAVDEEAIEMGMPETAIDLPQVIKKAVSIPTEPVAEPTPVLGPPPSLPPMPSLAPQAQLQVTEDTTFARVEIRYSIALQAKNGSLFARKLMEEAARRHNITFNELFDRLIAERHALETKVMSEF